MSQEANFCGCIMYVIETFSDKNTIQARLNDHGVTAEIEDALGGKRRITFTSQEQKNLYQAIYPEAPGGAS